MDGMPLAWMAAPPDDPRVVWEIAYGPNAWQPTPDQVHVSWLFSLAHGQLVHGVTPEQMGFSLDGATWNLFVEGIVAYALVADRDLTHPRILDMPGHVCTASVAERSDELVAGHSPRRASSND